MRQVVLTGSERRALRRQGNPSAFTRAQAVAFIASVKLPSHKAKVEVFKDHQSPRVQAYAARKTEALTAKASAAAKKAARTRKLRSA